MRKKTLLLALATLIAIQSFSQVNEFKLSDYKLPEFDRSALSLNLYMNSSGTGIQQPASSSNYPNEYWSSIGSNDFIKNTKVYDLEGNSSLYFNRIRNNARLQLNSSIGCYLYGSVVKDVTGYYDATTDVKIKNLTPQIYMNREQRLYFAGKTFVEIDIDAFYAFDLEKYQYDDDDPYAIKKQHAFEATIPLKIGVGRIEQVQDATRALYILDALQKAGSVKADITNDEITKLAAHISKLKRQRYFDYRIQKMKEYAALDTFLRENELLENSDIHYFAALSDNWIYANLPSRANGYRFSLNALPAYAVTHGTSELNEDYSSSRLSFTKLGTEVEFKSEKPINFNLQSILLL